MYLDFEVIMSRIKDGDKVLDLGGAERVFPRANVVVDLLPYERRKRVMADAEEHFTKDDWIIADFCSSAFWEKIPDKSFDFITIGHTLEDIRDPLYVCSQMIRCGKAGYIEAPSKFRELSKETSSDMLSGYTHHRWLIEPMSDLSGLIFKAKLGWAHHGDFLGDAKRHLLNDYFHHFDGYFWNGSFRYEEQFNKGPTKEIANAEWYFENYVIEGRQRNNVLDLKSDQKSDTDGRCLWVTDYETEFEFYQRTGQKPETFDRYF